MIIELLTPLMLTITPVKLIEATPTVYDHSSQRTVVENGSDLKQLAQGGRPSSYSTTSYNGTQTYDYNGRPSDADSDRD